MQQRLLKVRFPYQQPVDEEFQERLDNGWRILAICVQPDQRRPDYILGKTNT